MRATVIDIRGNRKEKLKKILLYLYLLNLSDLFFTKFLLSSAPDLFIEVNIFLKPVIDRFVVYFMKIACMALILIYWYWRSEKSNITQMNRSLLVGKILIGAYILINVINLINLIIYLGVY